jgi:hypothetical protein
MKMKINLRKTIIFEKLQCRLGMIKLGIIVTTQIVYDVCNLFKFHNVLNKT